MRGEIEIPDFRRRAKTEVGSQRFIRKIQNDILRRRHTYLRPLLSVSVIGIDVFLRSQSTRREGEIDTVEHSVD